MLYSEMKKFSEEILFVLTSWFQLVENLVESLNNKLHKVMMDY